MTAEERINEMKHEVINREQLLEREEQSNKDQREDWTFQLMMASWELDDV